VNLTTGVTEISTPLLGHNVRELAVTPDGRSAYVPFVTERGQPAIERNIGIGWVIGNRLGRVPLTEEGPREAIALDTASDAVGDVDGCTLAPNGKMLALSAGGTHEILLFSNAPELPFFGYGGPSDIIDSTSRDQLRRIKTGGRPLGLKFSADGKQLIVANDFLNAVQIIDVASAKLVKTIALSDATVLSNAAPSLIRKGEALFCDAKRSHHFWYSCASCHTEGHTNGGSFDTLNDGGYGKPKKTLSLRGLAETGPYTWHGWQPSIRKAISESFIKSMQGEPPTEAEVDAVEAYLKSLKWRKSPYSSESAAAKRGKLVFTQKACESCHAGPNFTSSQISIAGLEESDDAYKGYNPPSLRNVYSRSPYLHDGRANTLEQVLTQHHTPSKLTGKPDCTPTELADLVAYLKSL
jgi:cytochrome c peroxidase